VQRKAIGDEPPITCRPADMLSPGWEKAKAEIGGLARSEEDILAYALFPQIARPFLERRAKGLGGKEEFAAAIAAMLFQQKLKASKAPVAAESTPAGSAWKMVCRAGLGRRVGAW
jgi:pyruvate/oxaloacetate carboxyltransferase